MKKYYIIPTILFFLLISCSTEETKTQNQVASRPTIPISASEVQIGTQKWMTKNLNTSRYRNGDLIPQVTDPTQWGNLTTGAWCYYDNDQSNGQIYGKLYNWYAVNDPRGLAPSGWHVPTDAEWTTLTTSLGGDNVAGGKMKESGTTHWNGPNTNATNTSGFTGLPGGFRNHGGTFYSIGHSGSCWNSTESVTPDAWCRFLYYNSGTVGRAANVKDIGFSVRCLRD